MSNSSGGGGCSRSQGGQKEARGSQKRALEDQGEVQELEGPPLAVLRFPGHLELPLFFLSVETAS